MAATTFARAAFVNKETGDRVEGEFIIESSNAWQAAINGEVRVFLKSEWEPDAPSAQNPWADLLGSFPFKF